MPRVKPNVLPRPRCNIKGCNELLFKDIEHRTGKLWWACGRHGLIVTVEDDAKTAGKHRDWRGRDTTGWMGPGPDES